MFVGSDNTFAASGGQLISGQDIKAGTDAGAGTVVTVTLYDNDEELLGVY